MMRYQRVSPDFLPFSNGKKSNLKTTTCKEEGENGKTVVPNNSNGFDANFDGGKGFRFRSPSRAQENHIDNNNNNIGGGGGSDSPNSPPLNENNNSNQSQRLEMSPSITGGGDVLLQWGQKKRARLSRTEIRSMADDSSSSSSIQGRPLNKVHRRGSGLLMDKLSSLPPPPPPPLPSFNGRTSNLRSKETSGFIHGRNIEERSGVANGSPSRNNSGSNTRAAAAVSRSTTAVKSSSPSPDKIIDKKMMRKDEKQQPNGSLIFDSGPVLQSEQQTAGATTNNNNHRHHHHHHTGSTTLVGGGEKVNVEVFEWPKIYLSLSRKEKEDDFLAMKGTKLPHRPKKRPKNVDRTLQYCFPGMWLSDLTKSRYEVREKKSVKKQKRRGLKGMESMESDSE
ncbi:hypothetical protein Ddye_029866 [Dipteronia dyeriana]|uniref:Uncharacterized protein n=1 Tax=Dipteronia dyeriana TaxID=168575 RepID=A0AAD9TGB3_9ROSI|nr:hypothetical protein Ddye_029866 [Dipteronia dyeriana]